MQKSNREYMELYHAILSLQTEEECSAFLDDLFTIAELKAAAQRIKVARLLYTGSTCNAAAKETGASTATVSRVNKCLNYGAGGYRTVLERMPKISQQNEVGAEE